MKNQGSSQQPPAGPRAWRALADTVVGTTTHRSTPSFRPLSTTPVQSPFHQSFPAYSTPHSNFNSRSSFSDTPAKVTMPSQGSSSSGAHGKGAHSRNNSGSVSYPQGKSSKKNNGAVNLRSVKHLTCYYWAHNGYCTKIERVCAYSHWWTGIIADKPQTVIAGERAKAGKSLRHALEAGSQQANRSNSNPIPPSSASSSARLSCLLPSSEISSARLSCLLPSSETFSLHKANSSFQPISPSAFTSSLNSASTNGSFPTGPSSVVADRSSEVEIEMFQEDAVSLTKHQLHIQTLLSENADLQAQLDTVTAQLEEAVIQNDRLESQRILDRDQIAALRTSSRLYQAAKLNHIWVDDLLDLPVCNPWGAIGSERNSATNSNSNSHSDSSFNYTSNSTPNSDRTSFVSSDRQSPLSPQFTSFDLNFREVLTEDDLQDICTNGEAMLPKGLLDDDDELLATPGAALSSPSSPFPL